jgi:hypothetical protein
MAENINIGGRLHSVATGNIVTGANEVFDDTKGKIQSEVNQDVDVALSDRYTKGYVYNKEETYSKSELNHLITTPEQSYVTVAATDQTTTVTDVLPNTGSDDTVYRVGNWDGTQYTTNVYSEYAWNGSTYVFLDKKNVGIDSVPTSGSSKLVESGGVYADIKLCNVDNINDFIVDIVLKEGVDDPESEDYIDIASVTKVMIYCCAQSGDDYVNLLSLYINNSWKQLFRRAYNNINDAKAGCGILLESSYCYYILHEDNSYNRTITTSLTFNRDITWKSLNEHPVIKELMIEQEVGEEANYSYNTINGYTGKTIDESLTIGTFWRRTEHTRGDLTGYISNDVTVCKEGDTFILTGTGGGGSSRLYVFSDANGNNLLEAEANESQENYTINVPEGATYFYFTAKTSNSYKLQKQSSYEGILNELSEIHEEIDAVAGTTAHGEAAYQELYGEEGDTSVVELVEGYWNIRYTPPTMSLHTSFVCNSSDSITCALGDTFILTGKGGSGVNSCLWSFANSSGVVVRHAEDYEIHTTPYEVTAQEGEVYFYMTSYKSKNPTLFKKNRELGIVERVGNLETSISTINGDIEDIQEELDNIPISVSKMFNVPVNLRKQNLRILDLGNSYTSDTTDYLDELLEAAHITTGFSLYKCLRAGSSFRKWVNMYNENDDYSYGVQKKAGDTISGISTGSYSGLDNSWFVSLLKNDWDIIIIHQESKHSTDYEHWTGDGEAGGLTEYLRILKTYCPQASIGFYIVHSYPSWKSSSYQTGTDSTERWQNIVKAVKKLKSDYGIDFIIPYGTAVQNLRMTTLNTTDPVDNTKKNDFSADGTHLRDDIGDYVAACAYFEALFAPRYNVTVLGNTYTNTNIPIPQPGDADYYDGRGIPIQITAANALIAQRAAILAVNDMFNLNNPEEEGFIPSNTDTKNVYNDNGNPSGMYTKAEIDAMITALSNN